MLIRHWRVPAVPAAATVAVVSLLLYVPAYLVMEPLRLLQFPAGELVLQGIFQGVLIGAVLLFLYTRTVTALSAAIAALISAIVPAVTTLAAIPLLNEIPSLLVVAGIAAVAAGIVIPVLSGLSARLAGAATR